MKHILLTAVLIAAAVASGDLLAQATAPKTPASRSAALAPYKTSLGVSDARPRVSVARVESGKTTAK